MTQTRRILIVDDDADLRNALVEQVDLHPEFQVEAVATGEAALAAVLDFSARSRDHGRWSAGPRRPRSGEAHAP